MPEYVTPGRYRTMALGIDLSNRTDADLASVLSSAAAEVNRYCAAPLNHDFRGGTIEREEHLWDTGNAHYRPIGRLWPKHGMGVMPITDCPRIEIYVTKTNFIRFEPTQIFVNSRLGYVEPIGAPITTALFTSIPPWLLSSPVAYINYTYGRTYVVTDEHLYPTGGKVYRATNQWWTDADVTVKVNGVPTTDYTVDRAEGTVTFTELQDPAASITVSYTHKLDGDLALATGIVATDLLGYANINASGLTGLSGIRVEEIELRQSRSAGFGNYDMHPGAKPLLGSFTYASFA